MSDNIVFNNLTAQLSNNEREELLEKIRRSYTFSTEPFISESDVPGDVDIGKEYEKLGLWPKILIFFKSLFSKREQTEIIEEYLVNKLIQGIQREHPNLIDTVEHLALPGFYRELEALGNVTVLFLVPLQTALEGARQEFITYLAGFEMEVLHQHLEDAVNPFKQGADFESKENEEIKKELQYRLEDLLMDVTENQREIVGRHLYTLEKLYELCSFPFKEMLRKFTAGEGEGHLVCSLSKLKEALLSLENVLVRLKEPPEISAIQALFLFLYRKEITNHEGELEEKLSKQLERTSLTMQGIRHFNKAVPLVGILKYILNDINHYPEDEKGRSDWFTIYKSHWYDILDRNYRLFTAERKKKRVIKNATEFLHEPVFPLLHHYRNGTNSLLFYPRFPYTLAFLYRYVKKFLGQLFRRELQTILIDGEFYKAQNRQDFTDAYNTLFQLEAKIAYLEQILAPEGGTGKRIAEADKEILSKPLKKKKIETIMEQIERENSQTVHSCVSSLSNLYDVFNGILYGEVGGRYDTLSNLSYLGGSDNKGFKKRLDTFIANLGNVKEHLNELTALEK